jgi:hypothetical protein
MGLLSASQMGSPIQKHEVHIANDLLWITGEMESLGNPHTYLNQEGLDFLRISDAHIVPWSFSRLPTSRSELLVAARERVQLLMFTQEASLTEFRTPPNHQKLMLHMPLAIIRGEAPFLGEAKIHNFLDFWKGLFFPVIDAEIYYLADCSVQLPRQSRIVYVNRNILQSYVAT